jgi:hypothetical protein
MRLGGRSWPRAALRARVTLRARATLPLEPGLAQAVRQPEGAKSLLSRSRQPQPIHSLPPLPSRRHLLWRVRGRSVLKQSQQPRQRRLHPQHCPDQPQASPQRHSKSLRAGLATARCLRGYHRHSRGLRCRPHRIVHVVQPLRAPSRLEWVRACRRGLRGHAACRLGLVQGRQA